MNIVPVTESPKAAASRAEDPKKTTRPTHAIINAQLMSGT